MSKNAELIKYQVQPNPYEVHGDKIAITINGSFPAKYLNKKAVLTLTPTIRYNNKETKLKLVTLKGELAEGIGTKISFNGGTFSYSDTIPYQADMEKSVLVLTGNVKLKSKTIQLPEKQIAEGTVTTSKLLQRDEKTIFAKDNFQKTIPFTQQSDIHFIINRYDLQDTALKGKDILQLIDFIQKGIENNYDFKNFQISSYASPDGPEDFNAHLSQKRGETTYNWIKKEMKNMKVSQAENESFFSKISTPEDWEGFKKLMEKSMIEDKDLILRVLSMYPDPVVREREIKNISAVYKVIADEILPKLRRAKMLLNAQTRSKTDDEIKNLVNTKIDSLSAEELLYATTLINDINTHLKIYQTFIKKYPLDWRGHNNIGIIYLKENRISEAREEFEKALQLSPDNPTVLNNLGVAEFRSIMLAKAKEYFEKSATNEARYNLGNIAVSEGRYYEATNLYGNNCTFNSALAKLLSGDNDGALKIIECAEKNPDFTQKALSYYLKAIIGANKDDVGMLAKNLKQAINLDPNLKSKAKDDKEFYNFKTASDFISIFAE